MFPVILMAYLVFSLETIPANPASPFSDFEDQKDISRLEVCGGKCLDQYPGLRNFLKEHSETLAGLQVLFTSEIPKLTLYDKVEKEPAAVFDVSELSSDEILKILLDAGCYFIKSPKTLSEDQQLQVYLKKINVQNTNEIFDNDPPGIKNFFLGLLQLKLENTEKAIEKFNISAHEGYNESLVKLSNIYYEGERTYGIETNYEKAFELIHEAHERGVEIAETNLAFLYLKGRGVEADPPKAIELFQNCAQRNDTEAIIALGMIHHLGLDGVVEKDSQAAESYYKTALKHLKNPKTKRMVHKLIQLVQENTRSMTKSEIEKLERMLQSVAV